ncbi:MAG: alkylmercury lyase family protein [Proteobacteria bacterium]|nr:alkylmercury lyase family protein [Pseudomonadota bacterium]
MQALAATTDDPTARLAIAVRPGVTMPDWSAVTSGIVREALGAVFETCDWEERWAGLDEAQDRTRRAILQSYPRIGHAPSIRELALMTGFAPDQTRDLIAKLAARDMVVLGYNDATLIGAYPFIDRDTEHRVRLGESDLNAMCAIDSLGAGAMLGVDTVIATACRACAAPIRIEMRQRGTALADHAPPGAVVWAGIQYANRCAADSLCTTMAFFCSDAHLDSWRADQDPEPRGYRLSMDEGLQMGKAIFMPLLAIALENE